MTTGGRRAHSIACHPAQPLSPLSPLPVQLCGGGGEMETPLLGWLGHREHVPPLPTAGKRLFLINMLWLTLSFSLLVVFFF